MITKINNNISGSNINHNDLILCAVSGGVDSMSMIYAFHRLGYKCIVAHCNFGLRGQDSDIDEKFVKEISEKYGYQFISEKFDTVNYAEKLGISIQMAARDLRFEWFYNKAKQFSCSYIALAHNSDDQVETVFYNLLRGTGVRGLRGMRILKGKLFRPLLNISRNEIEGFAADNNIEFRTDKTNLKTEYSRNKIRKLIFPVIEEINPGFKQNVYNTTEYLNDVVNIYLDYFNKAKQASIKYYKDKKVINLDELRNFKGHKSLLYEILYSESLPTNIASEASNLIDAQTGKKCYFKDTVILKDRDRIIITKDNEVKDSNTYLIEKEDLEIDYPIYLSFERKELQDENPNIIRSSDVAMLDNDKLEFPLKLRKWKVGDKFKPLGMNNFKKLSDFFTDIKLSELDKSKIWLLLSNDDIVWVVDHRIDNRYKLTDKTNTAFIARMNK